MQAGFAERDITPLPGMEQPGDYFKQFNDGRVHDPLKARAVVFDDGKQRVALIGVDAVEMHRALTETIRREIQRRTGIAPEAIMIAVSHTHSGGPVGFAFPGQFDGESELVQRIAYQLSPSADPVYLEMVANGAIEAVVEAAASARPAKLLTARGHEADVTFNRRITMTNGRAYTHPGKGHPDAVAYAGPIDPEVGVVGVWDAAGRFMGCIVNFACHCTTSPGGLSADWVYFMERTIRGALGEDAVVVFLNGACGDITQVDNLNAPEPWRNHGEDVSRFVGTRVGAEVVKALVSDLPGDVDALDYRSEVLMIPRRPPAPERVRQAQEIMATGDFRSAEGIFAKEIVLTDAMCRREPESAVELQAIQVGPVLFLANPAELFCQLGLDIKSGSAFPFTFPVELANGCIGYVPTDDAFLPTGGGYETRLTSYSNLIPAAGDRIVEGSLRLANAMTPGPLPQHDPAVQTFARHEWDYGNVAPELE